MTRRTFACITACSAWRGFAAQNRTVKPQPEAEAVPKPTITEATARRLAYVIGNNTYLKAPPLHNAAHDASDIANVLQRLGFGVTPVVEADSIEFRRTFQQFSSGLRAGDIALFFYSGHGLQIDAENYLVPIDFDPAQGELGAKATCLRASDALNTMQGSAAMCIFVLDACRDNPFRAGHSAVKGLALMEGSLGSYIALAAGPGQTASDNPAERNGLFTKYLLKEITRPGQSIDQIFGSVKRQVFEASKHEQRPWLHSDVIGDFFFSESESAMRPSSGSTLIEAGKRQFEAKQYEEARKSFEQALRVQPENAFIYNALGATYVQLRQWSIATGLFGKAIELKPDYAAAYFNRGVAYHKAGLDKLAVQDLSWAIGEEPDDPLVLDLRGEAYFSLPDYDNAKADFDRAIELNPADSVALLGRGKVFFWQTHLPEAIADLTQSIAIHPTAEAYEMRSQVYRAMNRMAQAEADHQAAIKLQQYSAPQR